MKPVSFLTTHQKLARISQTAMARQQLGLWRRAENACAALEDLEADMAMMQREETEEREAANAKR